MTIGGVLDLANRKKIGHADITGEKGIALIHRLVLKMEHVWHPTNLDAGIDGYIELRDAASGEVSNCILQVQSKAGNSWFKSETLQTFSFTCDERDLEYWLAGNAPVLLIVSRPDNDEAYWVSIKDYFRDAERRKRRKIIFDKQADRFDETCRSRLVNLAIPRTSGLYLSALPRNELLTSNLLPISEFPRRLFRAETKMRFAGDIREELNHATKFAAEPEWLLHEGCLYSFHDLTFSPWTRVCISQTTDNLSTSEWAFSQDRKRRYVFVRLINKCISALFQRQNVIYSRAKDCFFFRAPPDFRPRKVGRVTVFKGYESKTVEGRIAYYRHLAIFPRLRRFGDTWYIEITSTYHFTQDGHRLSRFYEQRLTGIKQLEKQNKGHQSRISLWANVLSQSTNSSVGSSVQQNLFGPETEADTAVVPYPHIRFSELVAFEVDFGIDDRGWLPASANTEEDGDPLQGKLFE